MTKGLLGGVWPQAGNARQTVSAAPPSKAAIRVVQADVRARVLIPFECIVISLDPAPVH